MSRVKRNRIIDSVLVTFCISGALIQVFQATLEYMEYNTITIVEKESLEDEPMPAIGLCAYYNEKTYANHTVIERLLQLPALKDILHHCLVMDSQTLEMVDCLSVTDVKEYIDNRFKCYSLFEERSLKNGSHLRYAPAMSQNVDILFDVKYTAWRQTLPAGLLVIYPYKEFFTMKRGNHNKIWLSVAEREEFTFAFQMERHYLLPAPFSTNCVDPVLRSKYRTRAVALDKCILEHFNLDGTHYLPFQVYASTDDSFKTLSVKSIDPESERSMIQTAMIECDKLLGEDDCFTEILRIVPTSGRIGPQSTNTLRVQLAGLPLFALKSELKPSLSLLDYLNWVGSICNIWFAFTMSGASFTIMDVTGFCISQLYESNMIEVKESISSSDTRPDPTERSVKRQVKTITIIVFFISLLFGMLQISDILEIHFSTPFKWNYYTKQDDLIEFPVAIVCVDRVINETKVSLLYPELYAELNDSTTDWDNRLTVDQQEAVTLTANELIHPSLSKFTPRETMKWGRIDEYNK